MLSSIHIQFLFLEQTRDPSILIDIDLLCRRHLRKSWHRHDVAGQRYDEACTRGYFQVADSYRKVLRCAEQLRIVRKAILRLRHTDRIVTKSKLSQAFCLLLCCIREYNAIAVVDLLHDRIQFLLDRCIGLVAVVELALSLSQADDFFCQLLAAFSAFRPYLGQGYIDTNLMALVLDQL